MVVILIRRFARPDRERAFLDLFRAQVPHDNPDFLGETLTRLDPDGVPAAPENILFPIEPGSVNYLNVARWRSQAAFERHFAPQLAAPGAFDPEIETGPSRRVVLSPVDFGSP